MGSEVNNITANEIYCRLHSKINKGVRPTHAVEQVAEENYINDVRPNSLSSIWRYYIKLKKALK